ncbi:MAG: phosphatidate cytidylyltransferase [Bacteroidia bacterium]
MGGSLLIALTVWSKSSALIGFFVVSCVMWWEYARTERLAAFYLVGGWVGLGCLVWGSYHGRLAVGAASLIVLWGVVSLYVLLQKDIAYSQLSSFWAGWVYIAVGMGSFMYWLSQEPYRFWRPLGLLFLLWASDTGGYFAGCALGKHPLAPQWSPKKTWEGLVGSLLFAVGMAYLLRAMDVYAFSQTAWLMGLMVATVGTLGDLWQSRWKRFRSVKDTSALLPGHGGFLDRFDSLLWAAPAVVLTELKIPS